MASRASAVTQQWVDQQVDAAKNDNEPGLYSRTQAARQPRALYLRWKRLNSVMGAETSDTWMAAIGWGLAVAVPVLVLLAWAAWGRVGWQGALAFGILLGAVAGGLTAYAKWIRMVYQETYIEDITAEYHSVLSDKKAVLRTKTEVLDHRLPRPARRCVRFDRHARYQPVRRNQARQRMRRIVQTLCGAAAEAPLE